VSVMRNLRTNESSLKECKSLGTSLFTLHLYSTFNHWYNEWQKKSCMSATLYRRNSNNWGGWNYVREL